MHTILVVDDDQKLLKMLQRTLIYENLNVLTASNGEEALTLVDAHKPDLLIVDWMMPKMDGVTLIRQLRADENKTLVLMLTARDAIENRVDGLESGADDYLVKPFAPATHEARRGDLNLALTLTEFNLLHLLLRHPRQVLERAQILSEVWGYDFGGDDNVLEIYIGYLRKKLEQNGGPRLIHTVRGVGYVLREE